MSELALRKLGGGAKVFSGIFTSGTSQSMTDKGNISGVGFEPKTVFLYPKPSSELWGSYSGANYCMGIVYINGVSYYLDHIGAYVGVFFDTTTGDGQITPNSDGFTLSGTGIFLPNIIYGYTCISK